MNFELLFTAGLWLVFALSALMALAGLYRAINSPYGFDAPLSIFVVPSLFWGACIYLFCRLTSAF